MSDKSYRLDIVTPERIVFSEEADFVVVPGTEGYLGILHDHAPLLTSLDVGVMKVVDEGKEIKMAISGGFMEVSNNKVVVLADTAERGDEVDVLRAKAAKERAEKRIAERDANLDYARAEMALKRALVRLKVAGKE